MKETMKTIREQIGALLKKQDSIIVAIDGSCTAGKSTLALALAGEYDCNLIHMDDFFLRPEQRTPERLAETGGNVDYERFLSEVLIPLKAGEAFSYRPYDCSTGSLKQEVAVMPKKAPFIKNRVITSAKTRAKEAIRPICLLVIMLLPHVIPVVANQGGAVDAGQAGNLVDKIGVVRL